MNELEEAYKSVLFTGRQFEAVPIPQSGELMDGYVEMRCGCGEVAQTPKPGPINLPNCPQCTKKTIDRQAYKTPEDQ